MKIKTLLICFLAVTALSLTSCKKENYAEKFVGTYYNSTVLPTDIKLSIPSLEMEEDFEYEQLENVVITIAQVGETQDVTIAFPINLDAEIQEEVGEYEEMLGVEIPDIIVLTGTCDETGLHINPYTFTQSVYLMEEFGVSLDELGNFIRSHAPMVYRFMEAYDGDWNQYFNS